MNPTIKEKAIELIRTLSDDCTMDEVFYRIHLQAKIDRGEVVSDRDKAFTLDKGRLALDEFEQRLAQESLDKLKRSKDWK